MASVWPALAAVRAALAVLPGVSTCKVGFEANMTAADYPMVRIVPSKIADGTNLQQRGTEVLVYFGQPIHEFTTDLEGQWQALQASPGFFFGYRDTFLDEVRIEAYKVLAIRGTVEG